MKFGFAVLVTLVVCLSPSVYGGESDVIRVFDRKIRITRDEMLDYLKQANLEQHGFTKTVEETTETDENGKTTIKETIHYKVTDKCSRVMHWERVLAQRLPEKLRPFKYSTTIGQEVQNRIDGRKTRSCTVGLEVHPNGDLKKIANNGMSKRGTGSSLTEGCWVVCFSSSIMYE